MRGAGFALRKPTRQAYRRRRYAAAFGVSSIIAPFFFAAALGGVASGRIPVGNRAGDPVTSWLNPTSVLFGVLAVIASAFIAAVFLVSDARRFGAPDLEAYFRRRSVLAGCSLLVVAAIGLVVLRFDAHYVFDGLFSGWGLVFVLTTAVATAGTALLVSRGFHRGIRLAAIAAVASLVLAWGMAQRPYLLPTTLTIDAGAGDPDSLRWLVIVTVDRRPAGRSRPRPALPAGLHRPAPGRPRRGSRRGPHPSGMTRGARRYPTLSRVSGPRAGKRELS